MSLLPARVDATGEQVDNINLKHGGGTGRDYILAPLDRDAPELAQRVRAKEIPANAAAIQAGFRHKPTPLETLMRAWRKASPEEQAAKVLKLAAEKEEGPVAQPLLSQSS